jgi:hypothetical protein
VFTPLHEKHIFVPYNWYVFSMSSHWVRPVRVMPTVAGLTCCIFPHPISLSSLIPPSNAPSSQPVIDGVVVTSSVCGFTRDLSCRVLIPGVFVPHLTVNIPLLFCQMIVGFFFLLVGLGVMPFCSVFTEKRLNAGALCWSMFRWVSVCCCELWATLDGYFVSCCSHTLWCLSSDVLVPGTIFACQLTVDRSCDVLTVRT